MSFHTCSMGVRYPSLDSTTVVFMREELDRDVQAGSLFLSSRLTPEGRARWPELLRSAIAGPGADWLAEALVDQTLLGLTEYEQVRGLRGWARGLSVAEVLSRSARTVAGSAFNRYYAMGVCRRALDEGIEHVEVCQGKPPVYPSLQADALIGTHVSAAAVLAAMRRSMGLMAALGLPVGPSPGLTLRLPQ